MAKSNADIQKDKRAREKALLDKIGAEKRTLIVSKALDDALNILGARHDFEEWQETVSTFLINLAGATAFESGKYANMPRQEILITRNQSRQLEEFAAREGRHHDAE
jgi:PHD/YefM family antitoxin component YafN of YafNO toxin-antitoxin module